MVVLEARGSTATPMLEGANTPLVGAVTCRRKKMEEDGVVCRARAAKPL